MFRKVLFPTKFEEFSLPILQSICCLKRAGLEEMVLLHVIDRDILSTEVDGGLPVMVDLIRESLKSSIDMISEAASKRLSEYADYLRAEGIGVQTKVVMGKVVAEIINAATENDVSLIVAGRQKRDVLGEIFVGSTSDRVIRKSNVPVLVAKYHTIQMVWEEVQEKFCTDMFRKILYPTDWSPCSERAKGYLSLLHGAGASEVVLAHVIEDFSDVADVPEQLKLEAQAAITKKSREGLVQLKQELEAVGFKVTTTILYGEPYRAIIRIATEEDVSMIVMGSHGRGFIEGILWGKVSQRVVEYSEKPVLVVK